MNQGQLKQYIFDLQSRRKQCRKCPLWGKTTVVAELLYKKGNCDVLFLGINPGRVEAQKGRPFCGPSGKILRETIHEVGLDECNIAFSNAILCSTNNEKEIPDVSWCIQKCDFLVKRIIKHIKPKVFVPVGKSCAEYIFDIRGSIGANAGKQFPCPDFDLKGFLTEGRLVIPISHPASLLYSPSEQGKQAFKQSLAAIRKALSKMDVG